jgi:formylglycine-generating enzyme required for sulfatase activity
MGCSAGDTACANNELPAHTVTLTHAFEMMTTEVTLDMWRSTNARIPDQPVWNTNPRRPAVNVSWDDARTVCSALGGRLPTEAEWEYAARGGSNARYPWGNAEPVPKEGAPNGAAISIKGAKTEVGTMSVASFEPNGFGLFDIAGNAWEWVADREGAYTSGAATNPAGPRSGLFRVRRGGSWNDDPDNLRVSVRNYSPPDFGGNSFGVRCVRDLSR